MSPEVKNCTVMECFYNQSEICHAAAILVGSSHPACETFFVEGDRHGAPAPIAEVGECHVDQCKWNDALACHAGSINVDYHDGHADCYTFQPLSKVSESEDVQLAAETPDIEHEDSQAFRLDVGAAEHD